MKRENFLQRNSVRVWMMSTPIIATVMCFSTSILYFPYYLYHVLTVQATTLSRYFTQLHKYSELIHKFHLFQTVLMNEKYLPEKGPFSYTFPLSFVFSHNNSDYITKTILIDSPGFGSESVAAPELIETFLGNLKILQALYALSGTPALPICSSYHQISIFSSFLLLN